MIPDITYFVLDYNPSHSEKEADWLRECLISLYDNTDDSLSKVVYVLSQGNGTKQEEYLGRLSRFLDFHLLCMKDNLGISRGINHCVQMSRSPVVALVTSDTVLTKGMDIDLWCKLNDGDSRLMHATPLTQKSDIPYQQYVPEEDFGAESVVKMPGKDIFCIAYELTVNFWNRRLFDQIGFFDERWKACYENLDFSLRSYIRGYDSIVSGSSFVWHRHGTCYQNDLLRHAYDGYLDYFMSGGFNHTPLREMWDLKWPGINNFIDIYKPVRSIGINDDDVVRLRSFLRREFEHNIYLPYIQKRVKY